MNSVIGRAVDRIDGRLKVTGGAQYCAEMPIPNLVHAVLINSTIANGRIVWLDTQAAESAPGVLAILTHRNAPRIAPARVALDSANQGGGAGEQHIPLQDDRIHYSGQHIGVAITQTFEQAERAASLVKVRYEEEPATVKMQAAMERAFAPDNVWGKPPDIVKGDVAKGLADAAFRIDQT